MNNSLYIYSSQKIKIERLHLCTWDIRGGKNRFEFGAEILNDSNISSLSSLQISIHFPFQIDESQVKSLHQSLCDEKNSRYIFNDIISYSEIIDEDSKRGKILHFKERGDLAIIPTKFHVKSSRKELVLDINPNEINHNLYVRVLFELEIGTIATERNGIARKNYIFDVKINERRNMPDDLVTRIHSYELVQINSVFLFHAVPDDYTVDFYDSNKFKSLRKIEKEVFSEYTGIKELKESNYVILFNKDSKKESYSFYTCFSKEIIGTQQIIFAILVNILCSLLFAIPGYRLNFNSSAGLVCQFPWEWIISLLILIVIYYFGYKRKN